MLMNDVKYIAKSSKRTDGWYAVVIKEMNKNQKIVFEKKCLNADLAEGVSKYEVKRLLKLT